MMRLLGSLILLFLLLPAPSHGQAHSGTFDLRDLLTDFLRHGITLADPPAGSGFPSHAAHFIGEDSPQFAALQQFTSQFASQISSYPLPSPGGGFTYSFDPTLGTLTRSSESFGPVFGERADTIGRGKFNLGINHSQFTYEDLGEVGLRSGDLRLVFTHQDANRDGSNLTPWFEGDIITARLFLKVESEVTSFVMNYGLSDNLDFGVAVPLVDVSIDARSDVAVQRIASGATTAIHTFPNGTTSDVITSRGAASGVGDVAMRMKYRLLRTSNAGLSIAGDVRLPTGESRDLLGTGATRMGATVVGSFSAGRFSPHGSLGYVVSEGGDVDLPDEIAFNAGFDVAMHPRMTFAADLIGTTRRDSGVVKVQDTQFEANTSPSPIPNIITATFPRLVVEDGNATNILGSVGFKVNAYGNVLITFNGLFGVEGDGLQTRFAPMLGVDYSF